MNGRSVTAGLALAILAGTAGFWCGHAADEEGKMKPNIIFLLADDQATISMGCYGNKDVKTPNMDKLGQDGIIYHNHYDTTAICMASRASILTGLYEYRHGCNFGYGAITKDAFEKSYPVRLRKAGYLTALAGKFGVSIEGMKPEEIFDVWGGGPGQTSYDTAKNKSMAKYAKEYPHSTLSYGAFGCDFIKKAVSEKKPFCLSISFKAPHKPSTPDPKFDALYKGVKFTKPLNFGREHGKHFAKQSTMGRQYERFVSWGYESNYDEAMDVYNRLVYGIDVALGMIRKEVQAQGIADNTIIIYTSDNGYLCGSHGYGSKVLPYEESTRVPLIMYDPRRKKTMGKGLRSESLTANPDFSPTIMELAGVEIPEGLDGRSLVPTLDDPEAKIHDDIPVLNVWGPRPTWYLGVVTKDWKYDYWWYGTPEMAPAEELFHTSKDLLELKNLAADSSSGEKLKEMRKLYDSRLEHWKKTAAERYKQFGTLFDRTIKWDQKQGDAKGKPGKTKKKAGKGGK